MEKRAVFFIVFVVIVISLGIYSVILKYDYNKTKQQGKTPGEDINIDNVPSEIKSIAVDAKLMESKQISFENSNSKVYRLTYETGMSLEDGYKNQLQKLRDNNWEILQENYLWESSLALILVRSELYEYVVVYLSRMEDGRTRISVEVTVDG